MTISFITLTVGLLMLACLLGANLFEAVVDVPNWRRAEGLSAYRTFIGERNAGHFYRVLSPLTIATLLGATAATYFSGGPTLLVATALAAAIFAEIFTVTYFFPRNARLFFDAASLPEAERLRLVGEWGRANLTRSAVVTLGLVAGATALAN